MESCGTGTKSNVMKREFKNKRNMYAVVLSTCKKHQAIWSNIPAFAASVNALEVKLGEFAQTAEERLQDTTNITKAKAKLFGTLHEKVYGLVRIIEAYALKEGLDSLAMEYSISKTSLQEGGAKAAVNRFSNVVEKATELAADLEDYGLTAQFLQEITQEVAEAKMMVFKPRMAIIKRKMLNRKLDQLIDEMDEIVFKHLSAMLRVLKFEEPSFFAEFMDARNIIDLKGKSRMNATKVQEDTSPTQMDGSAFTNSD